MNTPTDNIRASFREYPGKRPTNEAHKSGHNWTPDAFGGDTDNDRQPRRAGS
jgi:hypothetical protein